MLRPADAFLTHPWFVRVSGAITVAGVVTGVGDQVFDFTTLPLIATLVGAFMLSLSAIAYGQQRLRVTAAGDAQAELRATASRERVALKPKVDDWIREASELARELEERPYDPDRDLHDLARVGELHNRLHGLLMEHEPAFTGDLHKSLVAYFFGEEQTQPGAWLKRSGEQEIRELGPINMPLAMLMASLDAARAISKELRS